MAGINKLSARQVATIRTPGRHSDGGGLFLIVDPSGAKRWAFLFKRSGKRVEMGLGGLGTVSLAVARDKAAAARDALGKGIDPREARKAQAAPMFGDAADAYIDAQAPGFRNAKHLWQWKQTLGDSYCRALRRRRVDEITTADVLAVLTPIWLQKPETADRLRGRIERVLDAAKAQGNRSGENPARWRGHLDHLLPRRQKLTRGHHAAMPWRDLPDFVERLRAAESVSAWCLEFTILTAVRTGEAIAAERSEFDLDARIWTIPAVRMKGRIAHRVPLTARAVELVLKSEPLSDRWVFPGQRSPRRHLSNMAMLMLMRDMGLQLTVHGFRSSFRDWAGDETSFPREVIEAALAHAVGNKVEAAYRRSDALEKRRRLMEAWSSYCSRGSRIVSLRA